MAYTVEKIDTTSDINQWNTFVQQHPQGTFLQTSNWAQQKSHFGWFGVFWVVKQDDQIVGGAMVLIRQLPLGQVLHYVPYGPLIHHQHQPALDILLTQLKQQASSAIVLLIEPPYSTDHPQAQPLIQQYNQSGFNRGSSMQQPDRTLILDLQKTQDQLLADMRQTTRRYIRQADKNKLTVDYAAGDTYLDQFYHIMELVHQRKHFGIHAKEYYRQVCLAFPETQVSGSYIFLVKQEQHLVGAYLLVRYGQKSWELYGGLTDQGQNAKAGYLLKWQAILTMKQLGVHCYDQWGIAPQDDPNHYLAGVTYFKQGFAGQELPYLGTWNYSSKPFLYTLARLAHKV